MDLQLAKGVRDFPPEEKILRTRIMDILRETFEEFGFSPLETPILERWDTLAAKYAGGSEILKETFKLQDQGGRDLALRYDLTVPVARFVGMNPNLKMPFKRYQMGRVFRDGPLKLGRYREFWQCDVDTIGVKSMLADAELLAIADRVFEKLEFDVIIRVNHRKLLNGLIRSCGVPDDKTLPTILAVDKLEKIGAEGVKKELQAQGLDAQVADRLLDILRGNEDNAAALKAVEGILTDDEGKEGKDEMVQLLSYLKAFGVDVKFDLSLARGLAYYTGPIFEVFMKQSKIRSAIAGGGRYDDMIGEFIGNRQCAATGISFGLEVITDAIKLSGRDLDRSITQVLVVPVNSAKTLEACVGIAKDLRAAGIRTELDMLDRSPSKNLKYADALGIPHVLIVGEKELAAAKFALKDMSSGKQEEMAFKDVVEKLTRS